MNERENNKKGQQCVGETQHFCWFNVCCEWLLYTDVSGGNVALIYWGWLKIYVNERGGLGYIGLVKLFILLHIF